MVGLSVISKKKWWRWGNWLQKLALIVGGFATLGTFIVILTQHQAPPTSTRPVQGSVGETQGSTNSEVPGDLKSSQEAVGDNSDGRSTPHPQHTPEPYAIEITLSSGQQKVLFGGKAAVSFHVSTVGTEVVPTLTITGKGPDVGPHALIGSAASAAFIFIADGNRYVLHVLTVDKEVGWARVRVDQERER